MKQKVGRKRKRKYESIFGDYNDKDLSKKVMNIPDIINDDYGYEMQFGFKYITDYEEGTYLRQKEYRKCLKKEN